MMEAVSFAFLLTSCTLCGLALLSSLRSTGTTEHPDLLLGSLRGQPASERTSRFPTGPARRWSLATFQQALTEAELPWSIGQVTSWSVVAAAAVVMLGTALEVPNSWTVLVLVIGSGLAAAGLIVRRRMKLQAFREQLPEVVSLLARSTKAGLSIEQSVELAREAARGRLANELATCSQQLSLGLSLPAAMGAFARRTQLREVSLLSTILSVHRETGGSLVEALERLSLLMRDRLMFHKQMLASSSAGRLSAKLIAPVAPAIFVLLMLTHSEHTDVFFTTAIGRSFLILGIALQTIGITWIWLLLEQER
jgi:Flp pilus assembly protein TadB